jgi:uncharacterized protein YndB with AHSA1/START domain
MPRVVREVVVRAPPELVFACLVDPRERAQWMQSMSETIADPTLRVGSRIAGRRRSPGSASRYEMTIVALDPPRRIEADVRRNGDHVGCAGQEVVPDPQGARVRSFGEVKLTGLQRVAAPLVQAGLEKEIDTDLAALKRHAEERAGKGLEKPPH